MKSLPELYRDGFDTLKVLRGVSVAQVADAAGTVESRARAYCRTDSETLVRVLALVEAQARLGAPALLERLAERAGFLLVPIPAGCLGDGATIEQATGTMREAVEAVQSFGAAMADGRVTRDELEEAERQITEAETALEALRATLRRVAGPMAVREVGA